MHDALEIGRLCPDGATRPAEVAKAHMLPGQRGAWLDAEVVLHVSSTASGGGDGTEAKPLTLMEARDAVRSTERASRPATTVLLGGGEHLLGGATLELTELDGGRAGAPVVWAAAPGEEPVISGASRLDLSWSKWTGEGAAPGVFVADLPADAPDFKSLYVDGNRYWPARWPNGDPRYNLFPDSCKQSLPRIPTEAQVSLTGLRNLTPCPPPPPPPRRFHQLHLGKRHERGRRPVVQRWQAHRPLPRRGQRREGRCLPSQQHALPGFSVVQGRMDLPFRAV